MSEEGRALIMRAHPRYRRASAGLFDVLATMEHDLKAALDGKAVLISDWVSFLKRSDESREALVRALFLLVAAGGLTSADVRKLRHELQGVTVNRRRPVKIIHQPRERQGKGLF
jgi:hypothetical protein